MTYVGRMWVDVLSNSTPLDMKTYGPYFVVDVHNLKCSPPKVPHSVAVNHELEQLIQQIYFQAMTVTVAS